MRPRSMFLMVAIGVGGVFSFVSAKTTPMMSSIRPMAQTLPSYAEVPAFTLLDQGGLRVTRDTLSGNVWIVGFIFTRCAGQCPLISAQMAALQQALGDQQAIHFLSISVDPQYDTPQVLAAYAQHYDAQSHRWRFVTGTGAAVTQLVQQGFHVAVGRDGDASEPITHSVKLVLLDRRSRIRGYYDATASDAMVRLQRDARQLVHERSTR